jgi:hypothetical protein
MHVKKNASHNYSTVPTGPQGHEKSLSFNLDIIFIVISLLNGSPFIKFLRPVNWKMRREKDEWNFIEFPPAVQIKV